MTKEQIFLIALLAIVLIGGFFYIFTQTFQQPRRSASNSWIMDAVSIVDDEPKVNYGSRQWWGLEGYTYTEDNGDELLLNANIYRLATVLFGFSYTLNGHICTFDFESIEWNETTHILHGKMKREGDGANGSWTLMFPSDGCRVYQLEVADENLKVETQSSGVPLWGAKTESQMLQIGWADGVPVYAGGFQVCVTIKANLTRGQDITYLEGWGKVEHPWIKPLHQTEGEAVAGFVNQQSEFYINFHHLRNPYDLTEDFVKQGRIGFSDKAYRFDNFIYQDSGRETLAWFKLQGTYEAGEIDLFGERIAWLHDQQRHPLIRWTGTITRNGEVINVNSLGSGEFRRIE